MGMLGERTRHEGGGRQLTKQSDALATDVNAIVKRHVAHGVPLPTRPCTYGDFSNAMSAFEAMNRVQQLEMEFSALPAQVRKACDNDPVRFLELAESVEGQKVLEEAGLVKERAKAPVKEEAVVDPPPKEPEKAQEKP